METWTGPCSAARLSSDSTNQHSLKAKGFKDRSGQIPSSGLVSIPVSLLDVSSLNSLRGRKRFPFFELPVVFPKKTFVLLPGWSWESAPKGSFLSHHCPFPVLSLFPSSLPLCPSSLDTQESSWWSVSLRAEVAAGSNLLTLISSDSLAGIPVLPNLQEAACFPEALSYRDPKLV